MTKPKNEYVRLCEAYMSLATDANYRPGAPSDGLGTIRLTSHQLADRSLLESEAANYAADFIKEENTCKFQIGVAHAPMQKALVYTIEAARLMCSGEGGEVFAAKLLKMALSEVESCQ